MKHQRLSLFFVFLFILSATLWIPGQAEAFSDLELQEGFALLEQSKFEDAQKVFSLCTDEAYLLHDYVGFGKAESSFKEEKYLEALSGYQRVMEKHPGSALVPTSLLQTGKCYFHLKNFNKAERIFNKIVGNYKLSAAVKEAVYLLNKNKSSRLEPPDKKNSLANSEKLEESLGLDSSETLKSLYKEAEINRYQSKYATYYRLFYEATNFWINKDYPRASTTFNRTYNRYPDWRLGKYAYFMYGRSELRRGRVAGAIKIFQKSIAQNGIAAPEAHYYLSFAHSYREDESASIQSLKKLVTQYPTSTYAQRAAYMIGRRYEKNQEPKSAIWAYKNLLKNFPKSPLADEATARIGVLYHQIGMPEKAYEFLQEGYKKYANNDHGIQILFWLAKSAEAVTTEAEAIETYKKVIAKDQYNYYALRAKEQLKKYGLYTEEGRHPKKSIINASLYKIKQPAKEEDASHILDLWGALRGKANYSGQVSSEAVTKNPHYQKYNTLLGLGLYKFAAIEAGELARSQGVLLPLGKVLFAIGEFRGPVVLADGYVRMEISNGSSEKIPSEVWTIAYPLAFWDEVSFYSKKQNLDPFFVLALMREESHFNPGAQSWAKAHGLMQIIPSTGKIIAAKLGIKNFYTKQMFDPETNIHMGVDYISDMLKRFDGTEYFALAAYNGGPVRVKKWLNKQKEEQKSDQVDIDLFVESIPLLETRNYVKKVMQSYYNYKRIYEQTTG